MCLLIYAPKKAIPSEHLAAGLDAHSDGWGIWAAGKMYKGLTEKSFWHVWPKISPGNVVVHFRFATHGAKDIDNCHPAPMVGGGLLFHNGVISGLDARKGESDTRAFARIIGALDFSDRRVLKLIKYAVSYSNKLVIVHNGADPRSRVSIINEGQGDWKRGIWYSNNTYKSLPLRALNYVWPVSGKSASNVVKPPTVSGKTYAPLAVRRPAPDPYFVRTDHGYDRYSFKPRPLPPPSRRDPAEHGWSLGGREDEALGEALKMDLGAASKHERSDDGAKRYRSRGGMRDAENIEWD